MTTDNPNERVTMRTLNDKLDIVEAKQRTEHVKTRALVVALTVAANAKALPLLLGVLGWHLSFPWS